MSNSLKDMVYDDFIRYGPYGTGSVVYYDMYDEYELIVELVNGTVVAFDRVFKDFRFCESEDDVTKWHRPSTEEEWRYLFARKLYRQLLIAGCTQEELSWKTGISVGSISSYLNSTKTPGAYNLALICQYLDVDINEFMTYKDFD